MVDRLPAKLRHELSRVVTAMRFKVGGAALNREAREQTEAKRPQRIDRWELIVEAAKLMRRDHLTRWGAAKKVARDDSVAKYIDAKLKADPDRFRYHAALDEIAAQLHSPAAIVSLPVEEIITNLRKLQEHTDLADDIKQWAAATATDLASGKARHAPAPDNTRAGSVLGSARVQRYFAQLHDRTDVDDLIKDKILVDLTYHLTGNEAVIATDAPEFTRTVSPDQVVSVSPEELISALDRMLAELHS